VGYGWVTTGSNPSEGQDLSNGLKGRSLAEQLQELAAKNGSGNPLVTHLAEALATALRS
jgi:hypothetical protein